MSSKKENLSLESERDKVKLKPLIKWSGGKTDEINKFKEYIPDKYDTYLEPFIGGGAVYFYLSPKKAVISDVHPELIDLYKAVKNKKSKEIYKFMEKHPNEEKIYYEIRDKMEIKSYLDSAKRFYYQRKTCFRGMLRYNNSGKFNIPFGRYKTYNYENLKDIRYEKLLSNTEIECKDFSYIFENYNNSNNFMFLDPPYGSEFTNYGYCSFGKDEHKSLAECFKKTKIKCLMIIGKTPFIEELYSGSFSRTTGINDKKYIIDEYDKKYRFKLHSGRIGDEINTKHLII